MNTDITQFRDKLLAHLLSMHEGIGDEQANDDMLLEDLVALHDGLHTKIDGDGRRIALFPGETGHDASSLEEGPIKRCYTAELLIHIAAHSPKDAERRWERDASVEDECTLVFGRDRFRTVFPLVFANGSVVGGGDRDFEFTYDLPNAFNYSTTLKERGIA